MKKLSMLALVLVSSACADPLVGKWEGKEDPDVDLEVRAGETADYEGDGHIYLCGDTCFLCPFEIEATEVGDLRYEVEGRFTGSCSEYGSFEDVDCEVVADGEELECDIEGNEFEYERAAE